jgi:hypothetical protein
MRQTAEWLSRLLAASAGVELAMALLALWTGGWQWQGRFVSLSATDPVRLAIVACVLAAVSLLLRPAPVRTGWLILPVVSLLVLLVAQSPLRRVGDGAEYVAMAINLAELRPPSLTAAEIDQASAVFGDDQGFELVMPAYRGADLQQDFPHFWLYSLLAAPFVRAALAAGVTPLAGFTALNALLLGVSLVVIVKRGGPLAALLLTAGPIMWWIDKAHTEMLTFACVSAAIAWLPSTPWWSFVALGLGAAQNPPLMLALAVAVAVVLLARGSRRDTRVWAGIAAGAALAILHPLYYWSRLGRPSGLLIGFDRHVPSVREVVTVLVDPNIGIFVLDPVLTVALLAAVVLMIRHHPRRFLEVDYVAAAGMAGVLLVVFTQTWNFNSGGTPGPSRYGLWLLPLTVPFLTELPGRAGWPRVLTAASIVWCTLLFAPRFPDRSLVPTPLAARLWTKWPALDNPLAEIFAERLTGRDPAPPPPVATAGCEKVLLLGRGRQPLWPKGCAGGPAPDYCTVPGALCYANRVSKGYRFARAPSGPAWRRTYAPPVTNEPAGSVSRRP